MKVGVDLNSREIREEIERRVRSRVADEISKLENDEDEIIETVVAIKGHLQDARRMLTRAEPSASEALIYIERALADATSIA